MKRVEGKSFNSVGLQELPEAAGGCQTAEMIINQVYPDPFPPFPGQRLGQRPPRLIIPENVEIQAYESLSFLQSPKNLLEGRMTIL